MKFLTVFYALLVSLSLMAKDATLSLDFSKKQTLNVNGKNITFDGDIVEFEEGVFATPIEESVAREIIMEM